MLEMEGKRFQLWWSEYDVCGVAVLAFLKEQLCEKVVDVRRVTNINLFVNRFPLTAVFRVCREQNA